MTWKSAEAHINAKTYKDPNSGCWLWLGALTEDGYGIAFSRFYLGTSLAHRMSYTHYVGAIPKNLHLDHLCRVRCCVNPAHLEPVTAGENAKRGIYPYETHRNGKKTHCIHGHEFTDENTMTDNWHGKKKRVCRICKYEINKKWRKKQ